MKGSAILAGAALAVLAHAVPMDCQESEPPYPDARLLAADGEFARFQALHYAAAAGVPAEVALATFSVNTFTTASPTDDVAAQLAIGSVETHEEVVQDADSTLPSFIGTLGDRALEDLARRVGSGLPGADYRDALLARLAERRTAKVKYHFIAHEHPDGSLTYYEVHRPYLDVGRLQWVDATRIRVIRLFRTTTDPHGE